MDYNVFEVASRLQVRFSSPKGELTTEDLWTLPLTSGTGKANLDDIARGLSRQIKSIGEEQSFVEPGKQADEILQLKFDVVKRIISVRVAERNAAKDAADRKDKKEKLLSIIAQKEDQKLIDMPLDELKRLAEGL